MATYKCQKCGIHKNDTLNSQLSTPTTCSAVEQHTEVVFHQWDKFSDDDLDCKQSEN